MLEGEIMLLDGAMGTNLYKAGMPKACCVEAWELAHSEVVLQLQREYVEAGARIIYAPTFGANNARLKKFGLYDQIEEMNENLVSLSKQAAGNRAYVAGDIAPTGLLLKEFGGDMSRCALFEIYREQAGILYDAGCDLMAIETMTSVAEAEIAVDAVQSICDLPIICTLSVRKNGSAYYGGHLFDGALIMKRKGVDAYGFNCCSGFEGLEALTEKLRSLTDIPVVAKPNAGMPSLDANGEYVYDYSPVTYAKEMKKLIAAGATLVGGCCGTNPSFLRKLHQSCLGWPLYQRKVI